MELGALVNTFRTMTGDNGTPPLWANADVIGWFNEAEREAANRARLLHDRLTPEVVELPLTVGQRDYRLHPKVFDVSAVNILRPGSSGQTCGVRRGDMADMQWTVANRPNLSGWADWFVVYGEPSGDGYDGIHFLIDRKPQEVGGAAFLEVFRYPLVDMEDLTDEPEIAPRHHDGLVDWVLHRAYSVRDIEGSAAQRSNKHLADFEQRFGLRHDANVQRKHRKHKPSVVRALKW